MHDGFLAHPRGQNRWTSEGTQWNKREGNNQTENEGSELFMQTQTAYYHNTIITIFSEKNPTVHPCGGGRMTIRD